MRSGVESLPDHYLLKSLIDTIESRAPRCCDACSSASSEQHQQQLLQAGEWKRLREKRTKKAGRRASHCCVKCEEFLCDSCARHHRQQRTTAGHLVVSVGAMKELCQVRYVHSLSNFYSTLSGRSTYINTKTLQLQYEKQKKQHDIHNLTKQKHYI